MPYINIAGTQVWFGPDPEPTGSGGGSTFQGPGYYDENGNLVPPDKQSGTEAADITAGLLRSQFEDWQKLFMPIELNAMQQLSFNNPAVLTDAVDQARGAAMQRSDTMGGNVQEVTQDPNSLHGVLGRSERALGVAPTAEQSQVANRLQMLNRSTNVAGAENLARANVRTQDEMILLGTAPNPNVAKTL